MTQIVNSDCKTREGCAIGLIDTIINAARILNSNYDDVLLGDEEVKKALQDLREDNDVLSLIKDKSS